MRLSSPTPRSTPRFTIERLRTMVLIGGVLLVAAIVIFLAAGKWKRRFFNKDLPGRLGINIEQQADGVNYTQTRKGKTIFKIHAARAVQRKSDGNTSLHDVTIDLYGEDGSRTDTISGSEFEYDPSAGVATAAGAVEITMMRPGVKPAITELKPAISRFNSKQKPPADAGSAAGKPSSARPALNPAVGAIANEITDNEIHVKTSGLVFNQRSGVATTTRRVDFALRQGNGNSIGATYDSEHGQLILDRAVELHVERDNSERGNSQAGNPENGGEMVTVHAGHAEFEHDEMVCQLTQAKAEYTGGTVQTEHALIHFREDGSVVRLDGSGGVDLQTQSGGHVTAPVGHLEFAENNRPRNGLLEGGSKLEMNEANRQVQGSSPTAQLSFDNKGQLSKVHLERGVLFNSRQQATTAKGTTAQVLRHWKSDTADVAFAPAMKGTDELKRPDYAKGNGRAKAGQVQDRVKPRTQPQTEPQTIHGYGGVIVTSETSSDGVVTPSKLSADTVVAELAPGGALSSLSGTGHASFEERTATGAHQASSSDQLDVRFVPTPAAPAKSAIPSPPSKAKGTADSSEIASIVEVGHVVLVQDPPQSRPSSSAHSGQNESFSGAQTGIRATANRADYDGLSQILHLTGNPRVRDGALDMTANRIDFARATGDAFAHGDVRASWTGTGSRDAQPNSQLPGLSIPGASLLGGSGSASGGNGPVHAIAAEAELHQATQEVIFRAAVAGSANGHGVSQPRLWQSVNSVSAPVITLNRQKQTLTAEANGAANPVQTVLVSNAPTHSAEAGSSANMVDASKRGAKSKQDGQDAPSAIRVRSGDLHYSEAERLAYFHSGSIGSVTAETSGADGRATVVSDEAEVKLLPDGTHSVPAAGQGGNATGSGNSSGPANSSIDRLTARGHVAVDWPDRRGTGEKLIYSSDDGTFTLTGTGSVPPRIADQARGTVTGSALIYHSRDGSVTVEGDGSKTVTETHSPK